MRDLGITLAGGGSRAFYQIGFMERWADELFPRTAAMSGCSAGSAMGVLLLSGRVSEAQAFFAEQRRGVRGHFDLARARRLERPFPHDGIYRRTLAHALEGDGFERVRESPFPLFVIASAFPRWMPSPLSIALGLGAYHLEKQMRPKMLHPSFPSRVGFEPHVVDARTCETPSELVELVISSSSTPPFTARGRHGERVLLDGSLIDNAPAFLTERERAVTRNLVLMTRPYPDGVMGRQGRRLYIAPSSALPITRWDYREQAPVEQTLAVGREDAARHETSIRDFLSSR